MRIQCFNNYHTVQDQNVTDRLAYLLNREHYAVFISMILAKKLDSLKKKKKLPSHFGN